MSILTRTIFENKQTLKFPLVQFIFFSFLLPLHHYHFKFLALNSVFGVDGSTRSSTDLNSEDPKDGNKSGGEKNAASYDDHLTPAERRYIEQREKLDVNRLARVSNKSHKDRIEKFNQYLANMSEHYDIPKVGPG